MCFVLRLLLKKISKNPRPFPYFLLSSLAPSPCALPFLPPLFLFLSPLQEKTPENNNNSTSSTSPPPPPVVRDVPSCLLLTSSFLVGRCVSRHVAEMCWGGLGPGSCALVENKSVQEKECLCVCVCLIVCVCPKKKNCFLGKEQRVIRKRK